MKTIQIEIPEGKEAKWINGVLTLVDEQPKDITERIKTYEDALRWCYENGYEEFLEDLEDIYGDCIMLCVITKALNEGWEPDYEKGDNGWVVHVDVSAYNSHSFRDKNGYFDVSNQEHCIVAPANLTFKSAKLAEYAARNFTNIYKDYFGIG